MATGNKFGWHSGTLTCKDAKLKGDLYVQDDIVFSDVSAGVLGITGGIDMQSTTSAIGIDLGGTFTTAAINIDGTLSGRAIRIGTKGKTTDGSLAITAPAGTAVDEEPANNYLVGVFSKVASTSAATSNDELRSAWFRTRVDTNISVGSNDGWGYGVCGIEAQLKFYGGSTTVYSWQNSAVWAQLESQAATTTFHAGSYTQCILANIGLTSATLGAGAVIAGVTVNSNTATLTNTGNAYYGLFITDKNTTSTDFTSGIWIADSVATTGITLGNCTTGISLDGDYTDGIKIASSNTITDGIDIANACTNGINISGTSVDGIEISGACTTNAINISGASLVGIASVSPINVTLTAPTASINAVYGLINASAVSTGNLVAVRGKVIVSGTTSKVSKTAVSAAVQLTSVYLETGMTCAVNAEISSTTAQCPNGIVMIQSLPLSGANFANVPYLVFSEGINGVKDGTGSNILFEVGHNASTCTPTVTSGTLFYNDTLQIAVNATAGVRTAYYIPLSTTQTLFTTAYPMTINNKLTLAASTGTIGNFNGIYASTTVTGTMSGSGVGMRCYLQTDGTARSMSNAWGMVIRSTFKAGDTISGGNSVLYVNEDMGANDSLTNSSYIIQADWLDLAGNRACRPHAFLGFQDWGHAGSFAVAYLMDVGMGQTVKEGTGEMFSLGTGQAIDTEWIATLKIMVNSVAYFIPLVNVES